MIIRIKELAEQARDYAREYVSHCTHYGHFMEHNEYDLQFEQKFADLIVKECTAVLFDESERLSRMYLEETNMQWAEEYEVCSNQCINDIALIEKHFGVE